MRNAHGQHLSEYVLLIATVASVVLGMQTYVRRGLQARFRDASESSGRPAPQYEPYYLAAPGGSNNTTSERRTRVRTAGHYRIRPDRITGNAVTEVEPQALGDGNYSYQVEWPPLP
jgi:hypothetical protein